MKVEIELEEANEHYPEIIDAQKIFFPLKITEKV